METDLFGNDVESGKTAQARWESNDLDLVQSVIATAQSDGYALVGARNKVYRRTTDQEIEPVPPYEAAMVDQLIARSWLTVGGLRPFTYGKHSGRGHSVLVPKATRDRVARWKAYTPLPGCRAGHVGDADTDRPAGHRTSTRTRKRST